MKLLLLVILIASSFNAFTQVKHNFEMKPEKTNCHELPALEDLPTDSAISVIKSAKYRFEQNITISRYRSPRVINFYSCDGKTGYMIAKETEDAYNIFIDVPKPTWDSLLNTNDPISFYNSSSLKKYQTEKKAN